MGLTFKFAFTAPATTTAEELEKFLKTVESEAQAMGFNPTLVFTAVFDDRDGREFARRLGATYRVTHNRLKGLILPSAKQVWRHDATLGDCWILPEQAVALIVTDEQQVETVFGFARYPKTLDDITGRPLFEIPVGGRWYFSDFVQNPDPRYRNLVNRFAEAGYLESAVDEFAPK